uniref:Beta-hexosaminidase n=1 Tax=Lotharella globosa TaxID=91324 RepID=A0A7S4DXL4_9EUKA|mmetsp:Transcript_19474/g.39377  ORF Transcript_19474/g.39377 Transcript_19474/m.39377 type:complete len:549 (-) Transcript_19474:76-1722(-)
MRALAAFIWAITASVPNVTANESDINVWPPPRNIEVKGPPLLLGEKFHFVLEDHSEVPRSLQYAMQRTLVHLSGTPRVFGDSCIASNGPLEVLESLSLKLTSSLHEASMAPSVSTLYNYSIHIDGSNSATAIAPSIYGLMYAMETFSQLVGREAEGKHTIGMVHSIVSIVDSPSYAWRGLMLDSGRRFIPVPVVYNLLDTMAANKLNVLHLHASDYCRFAVESKKFPNLTAALTGVYAGFYTQDDVKDMISYAGDRGIRVVPEFDVPGHSRGFRPLKSAGVHFCEDDEAQSQLFDDPEGETYAVVHDVMEEMAELFTDEIFNIGCDEAYVKGRCSLNSTFDFERRLLNAISNEFGKTPAGWEEVLFSADAATNDTIVDAWSEVQASNITAKGHMAIESHSYAFYFTEAVPGGPEGWEDCWYDISTGVPQSQRSLLLGGEMSMWTDTYCIEEQCGAFPGGPPPVGAALFDPAHDDAFAKSIGGMIWPRGYVAAGAFWNFDASKDPAAPDFVKGIWALNDLLSKRGALTCPTDCSCDQLHACGKPYLPPN